MAPKAGRKPKKWQDDAELLSRIATVGTMRIQGAKVQDIAQVMGYSIRTAWRDIERWEEVAADEARGSIDQNRNKSIAVLREVQSRAWEQYRQKDSDAKSRLAALKEIRECESEIAALQGTKKPIGIDHTTKGQKVNFNLLELTDEQLAAIASGRDPELSPNGQS